MHIYAGIWVDYDEDRLIETLDLTGIAQFGTQLHGGFAECSFPVNGPKDRSFYRYRMYLAAHLVLFDQLGRRIYEGFITDTSMTETGMEVKAGGYYLKSANIFFDNIYVAVEPTTNLIVNPSFEVNVTDGWSFAAGTGGARARDTTDKKFGTASAKLTQASTGTSLDFYDEITVTPTTDYTFSIWVKDISVTGTPTMEIEECDSGGTTLKNSIKNLSGLSTSSWVAFELSVVTVANTVTIRVHIKIPNATNNGSIFVDGAQFEQKAYSSGYCDGSLGALYHWTGTANNSTSFRDSYSATVYDVIKDCVNMIPEWRPLTVFISDATFSVGNQDFTDKKVKDAIEAVMKFGYREDDLRPIYFAIWTQRRPYLIVEPVPDASYPDWFISVNSIRGGRAGISMSVDTIFNKIYAVYDNQNAGPSKTLPAEDYISEQRYGVREGLVNNGSNPEGIVLAQDLRDMALERYKYPRQIFTAEVSGLIRHQAGFYDYPYSIRAGQRVLIYDLDTITAHDGTMKGQAAHGLSGFVLKTRYDASRNVTQIDFGSPDISFDTIMARLGLSGGLS